MSEAVTASAVAGDTVAPWDPECEEGPPAISVIVPHYNDPEGLVRLLRSLDAQVGAPPFEVVIVDNGSRRPLPEAALVRPRTRVLRELTPGPGPARTTGAAAARGELLAFIDADCTASPDWLARVATHFADPHAAPIAGGNVRVAFRDPARPTPVEVYEAVFGYRTRLYVEKHGYCASSSLSVRKAVFEEVGPFGGIDIAEDRDWGRRAGRLGLAMAYLSDAVVETPARADFSELRRKWDRHIAHDWADARVRSLPRSRAVLRAFMLLASPLEAAVKVATSDRISGPRARALALLVVTRLRIYRARRTFELALGADAARLRDGWRRSSAET